VLYAAALVPHTTWKRGRALCVLVKGKSGCATRANPLYQKAPRLGPCMSNTSL
jgi:hypothetical protein